MKNQNMFVGINTDDIKVGQTWETEKHGRIIVRKISWEDDLCWFLIEETNEVKRTKIDWIIGARLMDEC